MAVPEYTAISIYSFNPIAGVRRATGVPLSLLQDADQRTAQFQKDAEQLASLTKQTDPLLQLSFGIWAVDNAPSIILRDRVPLEVMIIHCARSLSAWSKMGHSPALNVIALDWQTSVRKYEVRVFLVGTDAPMPVESLQFFYEQQKDGMRPEVSATMPNVVYPTSTNGVH